MKEPHTKQILVVNGKGGCGKTTIATNLAACYACMGHSVSLKDQDSQASSSQWHAVRHHDLAAVTLIEAHQRNAMYETRAYQTRSMVNSDYIIIDSPSVFTDAQLTELLKNTDAILIPVLPSSIDIRVGARFIADLLTHRTYRARPIPVGVIANRVKLNSSSHAKLKHFLECLDVPAIATLRDSYIYTRMAEDGTGIFDTNDEGSDQEAAQWRALIGWLDEQMSQQATRPLSNVSGSTHRGPKSVLRGDQTPKEPSQNQDMSRAHA